MKLSLCAGYLQKTELSDKSAKNMFRLCKEAGFEVIDYTTGPNNWEKQVASLLRASEAYEMPLEQSHAPVNRYKKAPMDEFKALLDVAFDSAIAMGNKQIVIHGGDEYRIPEGEEYDAKKAQDDAYELWAPYVEKASAHGLTVAIETVFEEYIKNMLPPSRFTSRLDELIGLIDRFDSPYVKCCWDSGHSRLAFTRAGMPDAMRALGDRIVCTHIHDNYYNKDLHLLPFQGDIDWREQMSVMKEIGYKGNLTYELVYGKWPDALVADFLNMAGKTGKVLIDMFENA